MSVAYFFKNIFSSFRIITYFKDVKNMPDAKIRKSLLLPSGLLSYLIGRILPGSTFTSRVQTDLARYKYLCEAELKTLRKLMEPNEMLYLAEKLRGEIFEAHDVFAALPIYAFNRHLDDDYSDDFDLDCSALGDKIDDFPIPRRAALVEYFEQLSLLKTPSARKEKILKDFGGENGKKS